MVRFFFALNRDHHDRFFWLDAFYIVVRRPLKKRRSRKLKRLQGWWFYFAVSSIMPPLC